MVYLDNAANAPVFPEVLEAMLPWLRPDHVGNPGSLHTQGVKAREAVENARRQVAKNDWCRSLRGCSLPLVAQSRTMRGCKTLAAT